MATYTSGTVATQDINSARVVKDMSEKILLLDPERTPFLVFSKKLFASEFILFLRSPLSSILEYEIISISY